MKMFPHQIAHQTGYHYTTLANISSGTLPLCVTLKLADVTIVAV